MKNFKNTTIISKLFAASVTRKQALVDSGSIVAAEFKMVLNHFNPEGDSYRSFLQAVENTKTVFDFEPMMKNIGNLKTTSNNPNYMQMKVVEKIIKFVKAFGYKDFSTFDPHTKNILMTTMLNNGVIKSKTAFSVLTKCTFDALEDQSDKRDRQYMSSYSAGTGSTQLSSTRELFRILGVTNGIKGAKDQPIIFTDEAKSAFIEYFEIVAKKCNKGTEENEEENEEG